MPQRFSFILLFLILFVSAQSQPTISKLKIHTSISVESRPVEQDVKKQKSDTVIGKKYLLGLYNPETDKNFVKIDPKYTYKKNKKYYIIKEVYDAFKRMHDAALRDSVELIITSGTRNFAYQHKIWEEKFSGKSLVKGQNLAELFPDTIERVKAILKYSAMPGTSRHHWGTDIDLFMFDTTGAVSPEGELIYDWLKSHAPSFGFCQIYTNKDTLNNEGYEEEKWHWSYLPLSERFFREYKRQVAYNDFKGFSGSKASRSLKIIENFVININKDCF